MDRAHWPAVKEQRQYRQISLSLSFENIFSPKVSTKPLCDTICMICMMFEISSNLLHEMKLWPILWTYGQWTSGGFRFVIFLSKTVPFVSANNMIGLFRLLPITSTDCSRHMGVTHGGAREGLQYLQKIWQFFFNICKTFILTISLQHLQNQIVLPICTTFV